MIGAVGKLSFATDAHVPSTSRSCPSPSSPPAAARRAAGEHSLYHAARITMLRTRAKRAGA
jgi:hypothetical protein